MKNFKSAVYLMITVLFLTNSFAYAKTHGKKGAHKTSAEAKSHKKKNKSKKIGARKKAVIDRHQDAETNVNPVSGKVDTKSP